MKKNADFMLLKKMLCTEMLFDHIPVISLTILYND